MRRRLPDGSATAGVPPARMMRRSIRVGDASMMSSSSPRTRNRSPALGIRPAHSTIRPATVVDRPVGKRHAEPLLDRLGRDVAVGLEDGGPAGRLGPHLLVVLVEDLAHQLLEQILQRRDAEGAAELVEHDGEVPPLALHVEQEVAAGSGWPGVTATGRTGSGSPGRSLNRSKACSMPTISSSVPR